MIRETRCLRDMFFIVPLFGLAGLFVVSSVPARAALPECHSEKMILDCFGVYDVEPNSLHLEQLERLAGDVEKKLKKDMPVFYITIQGHAATWKPDDPVEENARARAQRVFELFKKRLLSRGVDIRKIIFKVTGAADEIARFSNATQQGRALNRRVEIEFGAPGGAGHMPEPVWIKGFRVCKAPFPPYPDTRWLDDKTLEVIRNQKPNGKYGIIRGNDHRKANRLLNTFLARWSCEMFKRNLLDSSSSTGVFEPSGKYTKLTEDLVWHFQSLTGIDPVSGYLDVQTLQAMDRWLNINSTKVKDPKRVGDPKKKLEIEGRSVANLTNIEGSVIANIFFPTNGVDLEKDDLEVLEKTVDYLNDQQATRIGYSVLGYADKREPVSYNQLLGEERTTSVDNKLRELLNKKKIFNYSVRFFKGEVERPQLGESADALRRFRRVEVVLHDFSSDSCWRCSHKEWTEGVKKGRNGCDSLCPKKPTPAKLCDPDETAKLWSVSGHIGGFCKSPPGGGKTSAGLCVMTGNLWIDGGPTNKGHFCRAPYAFKALGAGASVNIPIVCELTITKLPKKAFTPSAPVSFSDFDGSVAFESSGFELGLGFTKSVMRFVQVGKNHGITPPKATWDWGVSAGGLSCGASVVEGSLKSFHVPKQK